MCFYAGGGSYFPFTQTVSYDLCSTNVRSVIKPENLLADKQSPTGLSVYRLIICLLLLSSVACHQSALNRNGTGGEIIVSAAASLRDTFRETGRLYESHTGRQVTFNFGASGALQKQIEAGAPVDVFASAGRPQMEALVKQGLIAPETQHDFARNSLVLVVPPDTRPVMKEFSELNAGSKRIAIGNPRTVPAGEYARQSLTYLGMWDQLQPRLILAEDVRQVLDYVARGEVDAGIIYASDAQAAQKRTLLVAHAPAESHAPIFYPVGIVRASRQQDAARAFIALLLSDEGQRILEKYGFERIR